MTSRDPRPAADSGAEMAPVPCWTAQFPAVSQGSFPGTDPREPVRIMSGENPDLPSVPELPARGPGADMIGRALSLLAKVAPEFAGETTTAGWRLAGRTTDAGNRTMRRGSSWFAQDCDTAAESYGGATAVKVAVAGPWTVCATVELANGHRILSDRGAVGDVLAAYPVMLAELVAEMRRRWTGALVVQLDEPSVAAVLGAGVATPSGLDFYRGVSSDDVRNGLRGALGAVGSAGAATVVHCCAVPAPLPLLRAVGADALSLDLAQQRPDGRGGQDEQELAELLESGGSLVAGVVGWTAPASPAPAAAGAQRLMDLCHRMGLPLDSVAPRVALSTPCGIAGASPAGSRDITRRVSEVAAILRQEVVPS